MEDTGELSNSSQKPSFRSKNFEAKWEFIGQIFGSILSIYSCYHINKTRSNEDIIRNTIYFGFFAVLLFLIVSIIIIIKNGPPRPYWNILLWIVLSPLFFIVWGFSTYAVLATLKDVYGYIVSHSNSQAGLTIYTVLITLIIGLLLFFFRLKHRAIFGIVEAFLGLTIAGHRVYIVQDFSFKQTDLYIAILTAGIFLVVRGFDNIHQGFVKEPKDKLAIKLYEIIYKNSQISDT